jgi:hypothetical protein
MENEKRIELKATLRSTDIHLLEDWILSETTLSSLFPDREINNIYFETNRYSSVVDNIDGISKRTKVRYRWYGKSINSDISNGSLEFKRKHNNVGWKEQYPILLQEENSSSYKYLMEAINNSLSVSKRVEFSFYNMPFILNRYTRKYYSTDNKKIRVTVDSSIKSYDQRWSMDISRSKRIMLPSMVIVEFKFSVQNKEDAAQLIKRFPFRISKHSKYITSVLHTQ